MTKTISLGDREIRVRASARTPWEYRELFFSDLFDDMHRVCVGTAGADTMAIVERFLWLCAKDAGEDVHDDLPVDEAIPLWLDGFEDMFATYHALPDVIEMWTGETRTTSKAKKKEDQR